MATVLLALFALVGASTSPIGDAPASNVVTPATEVKVDKFANRPEARIAFAREVRNFQVKRDGNDDILFLETSRNRWYRSEITCFGIDDPRDAQGILPIDRGMGIDSFSKIALFSFGHRQTECTLLSLVELTPDEAVELRLIRQRTPKPQAPAS
jgi:hypothetical protein